MNEKLEKIQKRFEQICFGPNREFVDKQIAIEVVKEILEEMPKIPTLETAEFSNYPRYYTRDYYGYPYS